MLEHVSYRQSEYTLPEETFLPSSVKGLPFRNEKRY